MEKNEKQIFDEHQEKQSKLLKKYFLCLFCGIGMAFTIVAIILFCIDIEKEMPIVFISVGLFMLALGIVLYFAVPTKYSYDKYKSRLNKYGLMNIYELNAKIIELEKRIETLENRDKQ
ncbi:MAG: hypothetical protein K2O08_03235 [Clostridia bacterium]|nr:hypothetical protein [Clostridia bacterium]